MSDNELCVACKKGIDEGGAIHRVSIGWVHDTCLEMLNNPATPSGGVGGDSLLVPQNNLHWLTMFGFNADLWE